MFFENTFVLYCMIKGKSLGSSKKLYTSEADLEYGDEIVIPINANDIINNI